MHFVVATFVSTVAGRRIDDDQTASRAGGWVEADSPTLERESSVNGVESSRQRELDAGVCRIEFEDHLLGVEPGAGAEGKYQQSGA